MKNNYDVVIVGAGMAGSALACALLHEMRSKKNPAMACDLRIALIEARHLPSGQPSLGDQVHDFDPRVSALTAVSCNLLSKLGVWTQIKAQRASAFEKMQVWDANGTGSIQFDAADVRAAQLGYIVENRLIVAALVNQLREANTVELFDGNAVKAVRLAQSDDEGSAAAGQSSITLEDGTELLATLVVAADGAGSPMREIAGLSLRGWDYGHSAIVCTVETERSHQKTAWQCFTGEGPLAYLPLSTAADAIDADTKNSHVDKLCSIVWSQSPERAEQLMAMDDEQFSEQLAKGLEHRLGKVTAVSKRFMFPLRQQHATNYVKPGFAVVADAAHTVHPLAGQGINMGFADVAALAELVARAWRQGRPIGDLMLLQRYQRERKPENLAMMSIIEAFKRLFEPMPLPLMLLRNTGMRLVDNSQWLKNRIIRYAMGIR
jgi:2-octaprenylphenol hydroxylase